MLELKERLRDVWDIIKPLSFTPPGSSNLSEADVRPRTFISTFRMIDINPNQFFPPKSHYDESEDLELMKSSISQLEELFLVVCFTLFLLLLSEISQHFSL